MIAAQVGDRLGQYAIQQGNGLGSGGSQLWVGVKFGNNNLLVISPYLSQIIYARAFLTIGIYPDQYKAFAIKSRVHFHRGFTDNGYCKSFILTEPDQPFACGRSPRPVIWWNGSTTSSTNSTKAPACRRY